MTWIVRWDERDRTFRVPVVGLFEPRIRESIAAHPGLVLGRLRRLGVWADVVLPRDVTGLVVPQVGDERRTAVECDQVIAHLSDFHQEQAQEAGDAVSESSAVSNHIIAAPLDGIVYLRPSPEAAPFVVVGDVISEGQTLALIEVMKSFHPVRYDGLYGQARIEQVAIVDSAEVESNAPLFFVIPVT